jgi:hypothetical protein
MLGQIIRGSVGGIGSNPGLATDDPTGRTGNQQLDDYPLTASGNRNASDRFGWPVDDLGVPAIDHNGGTVPFVGPVLTAVNAPVTGLSGPILDESGVDPEYTSYNPNRQYYTNVAFDKGPTEDMVILIITNVEPNGASRVLCGTRSGGAGWQLYVSAGIYVLFFSHDGVGFVQTSSPFSSGINVVGITYDTGGLQYVYVNGVLGGSNDISGLGSIASGLGLGIGAKVDVTQNIDRDISRLMVWHGAGLADIANAAWHKKVSNYIHGLRDRLVEDAASTFVRATSAVKSSGGIYYFIGSGAPRAARSEGMLLEPASTNKAWNNHNLSATTGHTATGGMVLSVVNDSAALLAAGLREAGPNVLQCANATGGVQYLYGGSLTVNTDPHSVSTFARIAAGSGVKLGLRDASSGAFQDLGAISDNYVRTEVHGITPDDTDQQIAYEVQDGATLLVVWDQIEEGARCTSPIPNKATAASVTRNQDVWTTSETPSDDGGSIEFDVTPQDWGGSQSSGGVFYLSGSGNPSVWVESGTWRARIDGTTDLDSGIAPVDGVTHRIKLRWSAGHSQVVEVWAGSQLLARVSSSYDGTLHASGTWVMKSAGPCVYVKNLRTYSRG